MKVEVFGLTDKGVTREENEDTIWIDRKHFFCIVADGMGGHRGGKEASSLACSVAARVIREALDFETSQNGEKILLKAYGEASRWVYEKSQDETLNLEGMGSTMVTAFYFKDRLFVANVGDSRAYLIRDNKIWQLTEDHSWVSEQIKAGIIGSDAESVTGGKNLITRCIGLKKDVEVDVSERELKRMDKILLCSDGLTGLVSDDKIVDIFKERSLEQAVSQCVNEAKETGGGDNISVIAIQFS